MAEGGKYLFTGDVGTDAETSLVMRGQDIKSDVLKVPHHGSRFSSSDSFVSLARPELAVACVGRENPYRHPADEVIERYERMGTRFCRTDRDGAIVITTDRDRMDVARWSELMLKRIDFRGCPHLWGRERDNWERLWIRKWEI